MSSKMRRASLVVLWLIFVFVLLQFAGFLFYSLDVSKPVSGYGYPAGLEQPHPTLGYHYQPNFSGFFKGSAYQHIPIRTNAQGFRDRDFAPLPNEGVRVAVLGDSVVFGSGVAAEERFTECLNQMESPAGQQARFLNLGVHAYSFGHYLTLAQEDFLGADPDAVLLGITLNDFAPMDGVGPARRMRRHAEELHKPTWIARVQERLGRTYAARFLDEIDTRLRYALLNSNEREEYHTEWMRTVVDAWKQDANRSRFTARLDDFSALAKEQSLPLAFVLFPELNDLRDPETFDSPRQQVRDILDARGLPYCDPYDDFAQAAQLDALFLAHDSVHYTPAGHQLLCQAIERCLTSGALQEFPQTTSIAIR
ncbi:MULTISPECIES: SGNH/GDSL hydrolase family protein [Thiorhodovibrio]|uniref:SGNH/GDSL hydrolase family protein n=1 Tax=Thiorhodovibrio TaxID=61593 RepID=UPI0019136E67|nr:MULTISPECIES: SGNH/GDSL hydrolase family protein [Thiorhodovibrio]MBK5970229.1 hypothetical protein [Thiorhodovibrio winogradskyi]WPL12733.1 hypothetical protein Thiosp_02512 [Thiorhodovibrio litoralis]